MIYLQLNDFYKRVKLKIMETLVICRHHCYTKCEFLHYCQYLRCVLVQKMIDILFLRRIHCGSVLPTAMHLSKINKINVTHFSNRRNNKNYILTSVQNLTKPVLYPTAIHVQSGPLAFPKDIKGKQITDVIHSLKNILIVIITILLECNLSVAYFGSLATSPYHVI